MFLVNKTEVNETSGLGLSIQAGALGNKVTAQERSMQSTSHLRSEDTAWLQGHPFLDLGMVTEQRLMDLGSRCHSHTLPQVGPVQDHIVTWLKMRRIPGQSLLNHQPTALHAGQGCWDTHWP